MAAQPTYGSQTQQRPRVPQNSFIYNNGQYTQYAGYQQYQQAPRHTPAVQQPVAAGAYHGYAPQYQMPANMAVQRGYGYPQMPPAQGVASPGLQVPAGSKAPWPASSVGLTPFEAQMRQQQQRQQQQQQLQAQLARQQQQQQQFAAGRPAAGPPGAALVAAVAAAQAQRHRGLQLQAFNEQARRGEVPQNDVTPLVPAGVKHQDVVAHDINMRAELPPAQQQRQAQQEPIDLTADDDEDEVQIIEPAQGQNQDEVAVVPAPPRPPPSGDALEWIRSQKLRYRGKNLEHAAEANCAFKDGRYAKAETHLASLGAGKAQEYKWKDDAEKKAQEAQTAQTADPKKKRKSCDENSMADTESVKPLKKKARRQKKASGVAEKTVVDVSESESSTSRAAPEAVVPDVRPSASPPAPAADFVFDPSIFIDEDEDKASGSDLEIEQNPETGAHQPPTPIEFVPQPRSMPAEPKKRGRPKGVKNKTSEEKETVEAEKQRNKQEKDAASKSGSKKRKSCEDNSMTEEESDAPLAQKARAPKKAQEKSAPVYKNEKERERVEARANNKAAKAAFLGALNGDSADGAIPESSLALESPPEPEVSPVLESSSEPEPSRVPFQRATTEDRLLAVTIEALFEAQEVDNEDEDENEEDDGMNAQQRSQAAGDIAHINAGDDLFGSESVISEEDAVPSAGDIAYINAGDDLFDSESVVSEEDAVPSDNDHEDGRWRQQAPDARLIAENQAWQNAARDTAYSNAVNADTDKAHSTAASDGKEGEEESHEEYCQRLKDRAAAEKANPARFARERAEREAEKDEEAARVQEWVQARAAEEEEERQAQKELEMSAEEKQPAAAAAQRQRTIDEDSVVVELRGKLDRLKQRRRDSYESQSLTKKLTTGIAEAKAKLDERIEELQASF
ncbi:hypothetical protein LTR24_004898 [Lithohypha guttulata]|uniref:Uncharacterized protein n=1 Tax=Lithohypha guttulata TaxID=1690604 RepID=A0ABR0KAK6_9EURO|nr:hypothetical protein LTR24_004898 [Lithohypha guttulata]